MRFQTDYMKYHCVCSQLDWGCSALRGIIPWQEAMATCALQYLKVWPNLRPHSAQPQVPSLQNRMELIIIYIAFIIYLCRAKALHHSGCWLKLSPFIRLWRARHYSKRCSQFSTRLSGEVASGRQMPVNISAVGGAFPHYLPFCRKKIFDFQFHHSIEPTIHNL